MIIRRLLAVGTASVLVALLAGASQGGDATPGAPGVGDPYFPQSGNGGYHVVHYGLSLGYTPSTRKLTGTAVLTSTATQDLSAFDLDLSGLAVSRVVVNGSRAHFHHIGTELLVTPQQALTKGASFSTTVTYAGVPADVTDPDGSPDGWITQADGSSFVAGEPQGAMTWFPCNGHPLDKSTYDIAVSVPSGWTAVSNGRLVSQTTEGSRTVFGWHESRPMAAYLATADVGKFQVDQYWTASGLPVVDAVDPREAKAAAPVLAQLPAVISWESSLFGPYPYDSAGAVVEHAHSVGYALETQTRPVYDRAPDIDTLVHETAHQWFGDSVTLDRWQDIWLNEGFATYAEWLWDAKHGGPSTAKRLATDEALPAGNDVWSFPVANPGTAANIFGTPPYERGAMLLEKLRETVGDTAFFTLLKDWAAQHRYGHGDTDQFVALSRKLSPKNTKALDALFTTWLYGQGKPAKPAKPAKS